MVASKVEKVSKADFDLSRSEPLVVRYGGVTVTAASVDFQDKGVLVESFESKESSGRVRHVAFVPYSSLVDIRQDYVV